MPKWTFEPLSAASVEQEPTQRDQFNNDEVGLADALVREAIQNSTDAPKGQGVVKVRFALVDLGTTETSRLREIMDTLRPHLISCGLSDTPVNAECARVLVVEDFNTTGLTGATDSLDIGNFRNFWRRHGKSEKSGKALGRWGLGKLVYSSSSQVHAFFGLTLREGDSNPLLLGQAVLLNHTVGNVRHPAHGFWFSDRGDGDLQLPIDDQSVISELSALSGLERENSTGLSIIVPYPLPGISETDLISGVVRNYYFPILAGHLEVEVGAITLDKDNFLSVASKLGADIPFDFVSQVSQSLTLAANTVTSEPLTEQGLTEEYFTAEELAQLRTSFAVGELVRVQVAISLTPANGVSQLSHVDLFLQRPLEPGRSYSLFVRGSLTVPAERKSFAGVPAYGAMVASDPGVVGFLGDAENPAHTSWNANAEKLAANWIRPGSTLRPIRGALRALYQLVGEEVPQTHENALLDFFSLVDSIPNKGRKKKKPPVPMPVIEPRERALVIQQRKGGFAILPGSASASWAYPRVLRVRTAYDLIGGNPFKRHSSFDFDIRKEIDFEAKDAEVETLSSNIFRVTLLSPEFLVAASGFDPNRDLVVEARTAG